MAQAGAISGTKLSGITAAEEAQFANVIASIEEYSKSVVANFESTTKGIHTKLEGSGAAALQALARLGDSRDKLENAIKDDYQELEQIIADAESVADAFSGLDQIQSELMLLSDLLTTVEAAVARPQ